MTTPHDPHEPLIPSDPIIPDETGDARDEVVARTLAVEPLDELTRARLLRTALAEVATEPEAPRLRDDPKHVWQFVVAAAAAVAFIVAVAAGVFSGSDSSSPTASAPSVSSPDQAKAAAPSASAEAGRSLAPGPTLPSTPIDEYVIGQMMLRFDPSPSGFDTSSVGTLPGTPRCVTRAGRRHGSIVASAHGRVSGRDAWIIARRDPAGNEWGLVVVDCAVVDSRRL